MSYDTVLRFHIDSKNMTITGRYRSSNCFDEYGRRAVDDYTKSYATLDEFKDAVFGYANSALDGSLQFSNSSSMSKRLTWLSQNNKLEYYNSEKAKSNNPEDEYYKNWYVVKRDEETYEVLIGKKKVKPKEWVISDGNNIGLKVTPRFEKLSYNRWKKFNNLDTVKKMMKHLNDLGWVDSYGLKIVEV